MSTIINSNQIRQSGDTSSQTLINESQIRASGDISSQTLINPNQVEETGPYQSVDYIQSTGTQLNTEVKPDDTVVMQIKFTMTAYNGDVFLGYYIGQGNSFRFARESSNTVLDYGNGTSARISGSFVTSTTDIYEAELGNTYIKNLANDTVIVSGTTQTFGEKLATIKLFDDNNYGKVYYLKIWKGGELVRDYVPKYNTETETYGLYDNVNKTFLTKTGITGGNDQ